MSTLPRHLLPQSLMVLSEYCGDEVMWLLWENYAGGRLHVPLSVSNEHALSALLGYANACLLCEKFGGENLVIAKAESAKRAVRNALIREAKAQGLDNFTLARRFGLTDRQIMTICQTSEPEPVLNLDLFD